MRHSLLFGLLLSITLPGLAQDDILFTVGDTPVKRSEFEYIYKKNNFNNKSDYSRQSLEDYLSLYINFRLKVKEAQNQGLDKGDRFRDELATYEQQLLDSYLDKEVLDKTIKQEYERAKQDVSLSHIFFQVPGGGDWNAAYTKAKDLYQKIRSGQTTFEDALAFSEDKQSAANGGNLGWFNSLQIAYPELENAAYALQPGQLSEPVKTSKGYHLLRLNDLRPARKKLRVAIIKKFFPVENGGESTQALEDTMQHIYKLLKSGTPFETLVPLYSEDEFSIPNGGQMEWFGINTYAKVFEDAAYGLQKPGDFSEPFKTRSAWYIIKLIDTSRTQSLEEAVPVLKAKLAASPQYQNAMDQFVDKLKTRYNVQRNSGYLPAYTSRLRQMPATYPFQYKDTTTSTPILTVDGQVVDENKFGKVVQQLFYVTNPAQGEDKYDALVKKAEQFVLIDHYKDEIRKTNAEFRSLMDEYRNGIMIFDLSEKNIWNKAAEDTAGLTTYYEANKEKFKQQRQASSRTIAVPDLKTANALTKFLKENPETPDAAVVDKLHSLGMKDPVVKSQLLEEGKSGLTLESASLGKPVAVQNGYTITQLYNVKPARIRAFEECRGYVVAAYQEHIEKKWLNSLREKYPVTVNQAVLDNMVRK